MRLRWSSRTRSYRLPSCWTRPVDPSTSVNSSVTVPWGSSDTVAASSAYPQRDFGPDRRSLAGAALDLERSVQGADPVGQSPQARSLRGIGPADAVVRDLDVRGAVQLGDLDADERGLRVFRDVCERLRDDVVGRCLDGRGQARLAALDLDRQRHSRGECIQGGVEAAVREDRRMDAACELAQLLERLRELLARRVEQLLGDLGVLLQLGLGKPKRQRQRDEPLLGAVVQIPLEAPPLLVTGRDDARA